MKITKASLVYTITCNLPVSFMLTLTASLVSSPIINWWLFLINFAIGYLVACTVGLFFPLVRLGRWFTAQCKVNNETYKGNIMYRCLANFSITMVFFIFVSPTISIVDYFLIPGSTALQSFYLWLKMALPLITVGYAVSIVADYFSYHLAHRIDNNF